MPPFLASQEAFEAFLRLFSTGELPKSQWNHAAHLAIAAATIHSGGNSESVRTRILTYNATQGIVSTPDYGYHETITCFWVDRIRDLTNGLGRGANEWDAARATVAAFAHRGRLFEAYYSYDVATNRDARARYCPPDRPITA